MEWFINENFAWWNDLIIINLASGMIYYWMIYQWKICQVEWFINEKFAMSNINENLPRWNDLSMKNLPEWNDLSMKNLQRPMIY
jgi:hypothetical protein